MPAYLIANPKGGSGKSTLATNLAGYFANQGHRVMLGDVDRQQSSLSWLGLRDPCRASIVGWQIEKDTPAKPPKGVTHVVLDTPAGLHGKLLDKVLKQVDRVIVPVQPSVFDMLATRDFLEKLLEEKDVKKARTFVGVVGMRVDPRTRMAAELARFLSEYDLPVLTHLRSTQLYMQLAAEGQTLFDHPPSRVAKDIEQWKPLLEWVRGS